MKIKSFFPKEMCAKEPAELLFLNERVLQGHVRATCLIPGVDLLHEAVQAGYVPTIQWGPTTWEAMMINNSHKSCNRKTHLPGYYLVVKKMKALPKMRSTYTIQ